MRAEETPADRTRAIRSFVLRAGRMGTGQQRALDELGPRYVIPYAPARLDLDATFGRVAPRVLEIGFGMGSATAEIAVKHPDIDYLGIEVHTPGVGALLKAIGEQDLNNIRIIRHDAVEVLRDMIADASLDGVHIYFPDPWHKKRHHKRRLIQPAFAHLLATRLKPGGYLHMATDWQDYAEQMLAVLSHEHLLANTAADYAPRPGWRPLTKFEQRGLRLGHGVRDLLFDRLQAPRRAGLTPLQSAVLSPLPVHMKSSAIRRQFLDFFAAKGHAVVASSSLVPHDDPTLLFTNAGMNQFKDVFLGFDKRPYTRATTSQKCVRAGGKHNDLENVGYTARHHTFFEMLGNFSFGDYFKRDAIGYAWELLTDVFKLPRDKLYVTVYAEDDEAYTIWTRDMGLAPERVIRIGDNKGARYASDNFWMMGDTGPCGPCSEIFYDHGAHIPGGLPGTPEEDGDRYIEIWNNVFMQFNRDEHGVMHPLPKPSVDTGMGLERISAVLQGVHSNYGIDLFQALIKAAARETDTTDLDSPSLKVLADHIRACAFLLADGVIPGNEGRGFVLRRIIRRAIRHGWKLGVRAPFFHRLVPDLVVEMGEAYAELAAGRTRIMDTLRQEEERFFATIEHGMGILDSELAAIPEGGTFNGETAFKLHDTYGFPLDLTADICRERGVTVDAAAFDAAMARQREQARAAGKFRMATNLEYDGAATAFKGYETLEDKATILALYKDGSQVGELLEGDLGVVVLDATPFYAESGGQVGDQGELRGAGLFTVEDTQKIQASVFGHHGVVRTGRLAVGDTVTARVDAGARGRTMRNHSATHLMHKALREVLGEHVQQKGSQVDPDKTRFDFAHGQPVTAGEIRRVEAIVNAEILANTATRARVMAIEAAQQTGAMMLFGEKYGDEVRVLDIGSSRELCGGTHVARTGDIGLFKVVAESGVAAGVRRIEAATGAGALAFIQQQEDTLSEAAERLHTQPAEVAARIAQIQEQVRTLEKELDRCKSRLANAQGDELTTAAIDIAGTKVLVSSIEAADSKSLRELADKLRDRLKSCVIVLGSINDGKVALIAATTPDIAGKLKAGDLISFVAGQVGGKGGGKADMAQAGGTEPAKLPQALASVPGWIRDRLH